MSDAALLIFGFAHVETRESYRTNMLRRWLAGRFSDPENVVVPGGWATDLTTPDSEPEPEAPR